MLPVVPDFSHLDRRPNRLVADQFDDAWTNVMFVGRVIANKKIEDLIRFFHAYHTMFNPRSRLIIVGAHSGFERYVAALNQLAASLGLHHVHFTGHVTDEELVAYYEIADLFLCASEHEGFCVPIVESFYMEVPVLAYAATAVPATMDGAGVLYDSKDPMHVAALMDAIVSNCSDAGGDRPRPARRRPVSAGEGLRRHAAGIRRRDSRLPARADAAGRLRLLAAIRRRRGARRAPPLSPGDLQGAAGPENRNRIRNQLQCQSFELP